MREAGSAVKGTAAQKRNNGHRQRGEPAVPRRDARRPLWAIPVFLGSRLTAPDGTHLRDDPDRLSPEPHDPETARLLGGTVEEEVYDGLVAALNAGGYDFSRTRAEETARAGRNPGSLEFPSDWRRDIVETARDLNAFVERKAVQVAAPG